MPTAIVRAALLLTITLVSLALAGGLTTLIHTAAAQAQATFSVTTTADSGPGSLRQAILDANASPGEDLIAISANGTLYLLSPLPTIVEAVTLQGPGADLFRIDAQQQFRVLNIAAAPVTIAGLTVQHGRLSGPSENGAGIHTQGLLTLSNVSVLSNTTANHGGGVRAPAGLVISNSLFANNHAPTGIGGAVYGHSFALIDGAQFISNSARNDGGAANLLHNVAIRRSLFANNQCTGGSCDGGALFTFSTTTIEHVEFRGNAAQNHGGALNTAGTLTLTHSLFEGNQSVFSAGGALAAQGNVALHATHFLSNTARSHGAGAELTGDPDEITLFVGDVIFQGNRSLHGLGGALIIAGSFDLSRSVFLHNSAAAGGALAHRWYGHGHVANSLFVGNDAAAQGAAALTLRSPGAVRLVHNSIAGPAPTGAAAIDVFSGTVAVSNTIVVSHTTALARIDGQMTQDYNLFWGNGANLAGAIGGGAHSFNAPPHFVDPPAGDYHLQPGSPALDAGTNAGVYEDFDRDPRPYHQGFDIGFDELPVGHVPPTPTATPTPLQTPTPSPSATPAPPQPTLFLPFFHG